MWVNAAFPPYVSFFALSRQCSLHLWAMQTYPQSYLCVCDRNCVLNKGAEVGVKIGVIVFCCVLNCSGIELVGSACVVVCVVAMMPFLILSFQQIFTHGLDGQAIAHVNASSIDWASFLSMVTWNYANIENAGAMVEEVSNPKKDISDHDGAAYVFFLHCISASDVGWGQRAWSSSELGRLASRGVGHRSHTSFWRLVKVLSLCRVHREWSGFHPDVDVLYKPLVGRHGHDGDVSQEDLTYHWVLSPNHWHADTSNCVECDRDVDFLCLL
ncbi:Putrescine-cadaverine transporter [Trypanosoma cruzi]|uniref:Putrescine-cadaverine transporter n=1 Tax=Trypanosoma cruzi TaxID=5693 RepID=A0A2V2WFX5_TRYCR|nr:Putrescine-cadaverine transporter [Trypanosoma cruzi]